MSTDMIAAVEDAAVQVAEFSSSTAATTDGSILVRNEGGYAARFKVSYDPGKGAKRVHKNSGSFGVGAQKSIAIPAEATNITLKVEEHTGVQWSTIFTKNFAESVKKCYKVYGTTLNPKHKEIKCP